MILKWDERRVISSSSAGQNGKYPEGENESLVLACRGRLVFLFLEVKCCAQCRKKSAFSKYCTILRFGCALYCECVWESRSRVTKTMSENISISFDMRPRVSRTIYFWWPSQSWLNLMVVPRPNAWKYSLFWNSSTSHFSPACSSQLIHKNNFSVIFDYVLRRGYLRNVFLLQVVEL